MPRNLKIKPQSDSDLDALARISDPQQMALENEQWARRNDKRLGDLIEAEDYATRDTDEPSNDS